MHQRFNPDVDTIEFPTQIDEDNMQHVRTSSDEDKDREFSEQLTSIVKDGMVDKTHHVIHPSDSVYAAILFLPALHRLTNPERNEKSWYRFVRIERLALFLCLVNAILQLGTVYIINVYAHEDMTADQNSLISYDDLHNWHKTYADKSIKAVEERQNRFLEKTHRYFLPPTEAAHLEAADEIPPLCKAMGKDGSFSCLPYSVHFAYEWKQLDHNEDGVWTYQEAKDDKAELAKIYGVEPHMVFHNIVKGLRLQARYLADEGSNKTLYLAKNVEESQGIAKAYFDFWRGDAMMCGHFDADSCEAVAKQGLFDTALKPGRISAEFKGISDLDTAIEYCLRMLSPGGACEHLLPIEFKMNREQRWGRCGERSLVEGGVFYNPYDRNQTIHTLETTYSEVEIYERVTSRLFMLFVTFLVVMWYLSFVDEMRELVKYLEFFVNFAGLPYLPDGTRMPNGYETMAPGGHEPTYTITGITKTHRGIMIFVYLVRLLVCIVLLCFGKRLLVEETDYIELVMNSLALAFILSVDAMLFSLIEKTMAAAMMCCKPVKFKALFPTVGWTGYSLKKECWGMILFPIMAIYLVLSTHYYIKKPFLEVLKCACLQVGDRCMDSMSHQGSWWQRYWETILPAAIHQIEALRIAGA